MDSDKRVSAAGFLLAGGQSSRMGRDKALLTLGGEPLVKIGLEKLSSVCEVVAIAGGGEELAGFGRVVPDKRTGCGPLSGIVSALEQSLFEWNLFLPVDAPFVPVSCLEALLLGVSGSSCVCVMAGVGDIWQPLCAVYSRKALGVLQGELAEGRWKVTAAIAAAGVVKVLDFENIDWFANLNTPEEFAAAERWLELDRGRK
ncbi:MAG: molybdenum cofactor guanylyltransferase [Edaphobacter sp.]